MRNFFHLRNKFKICCVLIVIIVLVLLNNLRSRRHIASLDQSVSSIYEDRLLPATYLYRISWELFEKRLMLEAPALPDNWAKAKPLADNTIDTLVRLYDSTYLTRAEKTTWQRFKQQLQLYTAMEDKSFTTMAASGSIPTELENRLNTEFHGCMAFLNDLIKIQTGEGKLLQTGSHSIASGSVLSSQLEIALLVVLGLMAVILLSMSDRHVLNPDEKIRMN